MKEKVPDRRLRLIFALSSIWRLLCRDHDCVKTLVAGRPWMDVQ